MRWEGLRVDREDGARIPGFSEPALVRTFDAPEALGVRFYEVNARSAINEVPRRSRMPFRYTINPYRGCAHACVYCLRGDTPILMADGRTKAIAELRVGDLICGTVREGSHRRYRATSVIRHWSTVKPAYRVTLEDGTELVASGDHRFLTERGWKFVTGAEHGALRRPHLTANDKLLGVGALAGAPEDSLEGIFTRKRSIEGIALKSNARLGVVSIEGLRSSERLFDITTGTGDFIANGVVSHNCFARPTHSYLDFNAREDFEREIVVKVNAPERLRAELARPRWRGEHVALGTNTDPYQWVEGRYRLMEGIWEAMRDFANPCSVLTKSPLLLRDLDLMRELTERTEFVANLSVPTLEEKAWRATEPHTPHPRKRLEAVAELVRAGVPAGVLVAPLMPGINDSPEQVEEILELAGEAGARSVGGVALHLRGEVREIWFDWLRQYRADLVPRYEDLYRRGAYMRQPERDRLAALARRGTKPRRFTEEPSRGRGQRRPAKRSRGGSAEPPLGQSRLF